MHKKPLSILYFSVNPPNKSMRDAPYINGLKERGVAFLECYDATNGVLKYWRLLKKFFSFKEKHDLVFVGHTATSIVFLARIFSRKPIVFNALCPLYDGMVLEREAHSWYSPRAFFIWFLDFLSFHLSTAVLLETDRQVEYVSTHYFMPRRKLFRVFTTVDPSEYYPDPAIKKHSDFLCVFRGWLTPATGAEHIVEAARILKDTNIRFRFISRGQSVPAIQALIERYQLTNVEFFEGFYPSDELRRMILEGHVYLGQFGNHTRLEKTIQFKTVEACAFGLPYITADLPANRELLHDREDVLFVRRADPKDIANKILMLKNDPVLRERLGSASYALYQKELAPNVLAEQIFGIITSFVP